MNKKIIVRADHYPDGYIMPLGFTDSSGKTIYIDRVLDITEIRELRKVFVDSNELFATYTLDSIVGYYLNYNRCDVKLRSKLCALCGFSKQAALIETHKNIENM